MGRNFPVDENTTIHPFISTSFFFACIAASLAIISSLCGALSFRKPKSPTDETKENKDPNAPPSAAVLSPENPPATPPSEIEVPESQSDVESSNHPLPPPPGRRHLSGAASYHVRSDSSASQTAAATNLPSSRSMRVLGNGFSSRQGSKRENGEKEKEKKKKEKNLKHEDSIWKKTIILGDKCRVPDDDDDAILYDEKGNRISTYHKKNANSMALSRQSSGIDQDAIPSKSYPGSE